MADEALLDVIVRDLDEYLNVAEVPDSSTALNGLQVANRGRVHRIAAAVDASQRTIDTARASGCDLLVVHHGLFWDGNQPVTGRRYQRLRSLFEGDMAVYSAHLPLDVHDEVGNNVLLARALGVELKGTFGSYKGIPVGRWGTLGVRREVLAARLDDLLGVRVHMMPFGPEVIERVGVVTGGAGDLIPQAVEAGLHAFVTGEGSHHTHFEAEEGGINVFYAGHYATETWGVRALAERVSERYGLPWQFIDHPTGL